MYIAHNTLTCPCYFLLHLYYFLLTSIHSSSYIVYASESHEALQATSRENCPLMESTEGDAPFQRGRILEPSSPPEPKNSF